MAGLSLHNDAATTTGYAVASEPRAAAAGNAAAGAAGTEAGDDCLSDAVCLLSSGTAAAEAALSLLPKLPGPLSVFEGPLADLWFLCFELFCCRLSLSPYQVQHRLQGALGSILERNAEEPLTGALGATCGFAFLSYREARALVLRRAFPSQGAARVAAAAADLRGKNLHPREAVGMLLLLQLLHRRAQRVYALYERAPQKPLAHNTLISILLEALRPAEASAASALQKTLQQQRLQPSFEAFGSFLLLATEGPWKSLVPCAGGLPQGPPRRLPSPTNFSASSVKKRPLEEEQTSISASRRRVLHHVGDTHSRSAFESL
ncbi:hypothetical protein, conserved [Eimeria necatrix]|uniref:Uncharacterized protein n=1 Tax=Eimeria necatrix TaxID=51315 RepID=U6MYV6_9EIME|nr:hypothetical protein, conserved [Eimeria necatrix]CDJ67669.1 hypothetical protein, conserved [Eimeria necatrix]